MHFLVFGFSFLIYANTIPNLYNLDDELVTSTSPAKPHRLTSKGIGAIAEIFSEPYFADKQGYAYDYRPVVLATFAVEYTLFGANPHVSHFFNVLLYALLCVLLYVTLRLLFRDYNPLLALLATLLFAAHPIHTEVVASIKNRDEMLSLAGGTGALFLFCQFVLKKKIWLLPAAAACFALGMMSKSTVISFIYIIPVLLILFATPSLKNLLMIAFILAAGAFPFIHKAFWDERIAITAGALLFSAAVYQIRNPMLIRRIIHAASHWREIARNIKNRMTGEFSESSSIPEGFRLGSFTTWVLLGMLALVALVFFFISSFKYAFPAFLYIIPLIGLFPLAAFAHPQAKIYLTWLCWAVAQYIIHRTYLAPDSGVLVFTHLFVFFAYHLIVEKRRKIQHLLMLLLLLFPGPPVGEVTRDNLIITIVLIGTIGVAFTPYFKWYKWLVLVYIAGPYLAGPFINLEHFKSGLRPLNFLSIVTVLLIFFLPRRKTWIVSLITLSLTLFAFRNAYTLQTGVHLKPPSYKKTLVPGGTFINRPIDYAENVVSGQTPFSEKAGTGMMVIGKYMRLTAIPYPMSFYYGYKVIEKKDIGELVPVAIAVAAAWLVAAAFIGFNRIPVVSASLLIYFLSVFPVANIVLPIPGMMGDRFLFIPSLGFCILLAYLLMTLFKIPKNSREVIAFRSLPGSFKYAALFVLLLYAGLTVARNRHWHDTLTLMRHDIRHLSESAQAHNLLASNLVLAALAESNIKAGRSLMLEAETHYEKAVTIYPEFFNAMYDLGRVRLMLGKLNESEAAFLKAIELDSTFADPFFQIGALRESRKDYKGAIDFYSKYLRKMPGNLDALISMGFCYAQMRDLQSALKLMKEAAALHPARPEPLFNQCRIFADMGLMDSARFYLHQAELLAPSHPDAAKLKEALGKVN